MPRYTLRTLLILLAVGPPIGAYGWWLSQQNDWANRLESIVVDFGGIATLAIPFIIFAYIAARVASAITGR